MQRQKTFQLKNFPRYQNSVAIKKVKTYLTLNTIVFEDEIEEADKIISVAKKAKIDRIICSDLAVAELCNKNKIPFCISTQSSISNSLSASVYKKLGAVRIVLARECSLEEIKKDIERILILKLKHSFTVRCALQLAEDVL